MKGRWAPRLRSIGVQPSFTFTLHFQAWAPAACSREARAPLRGSHQFNAIIFQTNFFVAFLNPVTHTVAYHNATYNECYKVTVLLVNYWKGSKYWLIPISGVHGPGSPWARPGLEIHLVRWAGPKTNIGLCGQRLVTNLYTKVKSMWNIMTLSRILQ